MSGYDAEPLTFSEYAAQFPEGDYGEYIDGYMDEHLSTELRLYAFDMSSYETLASEDVWLSSSMFLCRYGDLSLYAVGDTLYCYDFAAGESRELCTQEGLVNFWAMDGKAFYISNTGTLELRYCDLAGGPETLDGERGPQCRGRRHSHLTLRRVRRVHLRHTLARGQRPRRHKQGGLLRRKLRRANSDGVRTWSLSLTR